MISKALTNEHKNEFYEFLQHQKSLNLSKGRHWFIDYDVNDITEVEFNNDTRQLFGAFKDDKLVACCACRIWQTMPYTTFDTFVVDKSLGYSQSRKAVSINKINALTWAESNGRVNHIYVGPKRESRLMTSKKGLWTPAIKEMNYIVTEVGIVPANTQVDHKFINYLMYHKTYPTDMLVFMLVKDITNLPDNWDEIIKLKSI